MGKQITPKKMAPVVETLDSAIHRINPYPEEKYSLEAGDFSLLPETSAQLRYTLDRDLSSRLRLNNRCLVLICLCLCYRYTLHFFEETTTRSRP